MRKLTRRLGPEVVHQLSRELIGKARREKRFRPRAARIDSTVVEADIRYRTDSGLAADGVRALAREGRKSAALVKAKRTAVRDRSRAAGRRLRGITRTMRHRSGQAKQDVLKLTRQTGELLAKSVKEARRLAANGQAPRPGARRPGQAQGRASARGAGRPLREGRRADHQACQGREDHRPAHLAVGSGRPADPQGQALTAQPIRLCRSALRDHRQHQAGRARVHPPALKPDRQRGRGHAARRPPQPSWGNLGIKLREVMGSTAGSTRASTNTALEGLADEVHITGRQEPGSRRTRRRLQRYRTGAEGRVSHLGRRYGLRRGHVGRSGVTSVG